MLQNYLCLSQIMTDRVILGNPFMCLLYSFTTDSEGITTHPFDQLVKFKFLRSPESQGISSLQDVRIGCKDICCKNKSANVLSQ